MQDTKNEHADTYRFLEDCEKWYGIKIERISNPDYETIEETWYKHKSLNTANGAICSYKLKRVCRERWERENTFDHQVFGFEYNKKEIQRAKSLKLNHPQTNAIFPLIDLELTKENCISIVIQAGIEIPQAYKLGYHNNNCLNTGCVQGGIGYWKKIQVDNPAAFDKMAKVEHDLTDMRGFPVTMLKNQSKRNKSTNYQDNLVFLKPHPDYPNHKCIDDMRGRKVKPLNDCNGFCGVEDLSERSKTEQEINWMEL